MTRPPPPHGLMRRRSVLRAFGVAAWRSVAPVAGVLALGASRAAAAADPELSSFEVGRDEDGVFLAYSVDFDLGKSVEEALMKSVPLFFVAEAELFRDRWYWRDRRVAHAVRVWKIVFQPLTSTYRVTSVGGLSQSYATRAEAIASISRNAHWKIADPGQIEEGSRHYVQFSYRLDIALLPRPMQIGIGSQPDWQLEVKRFQRIN